MGDTTYRIGEVAEMLHIKSYVLRFWETEFPQLAPLRTEKGQRLYTDDHIALLRRIQHLLHEKGMTIDGARRLLAGEQEDTPAEHVPSRGGLTPEALTLVREELLALRALLTQGTRS